jgi:hypothetical protein
MYTTLCERTLPLRLRLIDCLVETILLSTLVKQSIIYLLTFQLINKNFLIIVVPYWATRTRLHILIAIYFEAESYHYVNNDWMCINCAKS